MQSTLVLRIALLLCSLSSLIGTSHAQEASLREAPLRIVVDSIHAHNALHTPGEADAYSYHSVYGYRRAFDYLKSRGAQVDEITSGRLDAKTLAGARMLFINLVSGDLPPFFVSEIAAIKNYIEDGGSLLLITDHTNAYYHAYKLWPLLEELGIEIRTETAADRAPATLGSGNGWIAVTRFSPHPVTRELKAIAFQTGGTVDDRYAVATTSPRGWGDNWTYHPYGESDGNGLGDAPGFFGNWRQDDYERSGALGVIAAKEFGKGRIAIVADQNVFGDPFLNYADNYRLWLNSAAWLTGEKHLGDVAAYARWREKRVLAYEEYSEAAFGNGAPGGYYHLFVALGRHMWLFAGDRLDEDADLIVFARDDYQLSEEALAGAIRHLQAGRNIFVLGPGPNRAEKRRSLLEQLQSKLGAPTVEQSEAGGYAVQSHSWPETGELFLLPANKPFQNSAIPAPEAKPSAQQELILSTLRQLLEAAME